MNVFIDYELSSDNIEHMRDILRDADIIGWTLCCYAPIGKLIFLANGHDYGNYHSPLTSDCQVPLLEFAIIFDEILEKIVVGKELEIIHFEGPSSIKFKRLSEDEVLIQGLSKDIPVTIVSYKELRSAANNFFRKLHLEISKSFPEYLVKLDSNPSEPNLYPNWQDLL